MWPGRERTQREAAGPVLLTTQLPSTGPAGAGRAGTWEEDTEPHGRKNVSTPQRCAAGLVCAAPVGTGTRAVAMTAATV